MKTGGSPFSFRAQKAFTLIELIGVLAIISILASILVPNTLRSIESAAIKAEATNLQNLGDSVKLYLRKNRVLPGTNVFPATASWSTDLALFADLSAADVLTSRRQQTRVFVIEPTVVPATRALLISSMSQGLAVPPAASLNTLPLFNTVWSTIDGNAPGGAPWTTSGWNATTAQYLTIQRINLQAVNSTDLQTFTVTVNNSVTTPPTTNVSYIFTPFGAASQPRVTITPGNMSSIVGVKPKDRLDLYATAASVTPSYTQIFSSSGTNSTTFSWVAPVPQTVPVTAPCWRPQ